MQIVTKKQEQTLIVIEGFSEAVRVGQVTNLVSYTYDTKAVHLMLGRLTEMGLLTREMLPYKHGYRRINAWFYTRTDVPYKFGKLKRNPPTIQEPDLPNGLDAFLNLRRPS